MPFLLRVDWGSWDIPGPVTLAFAFTALLYLRGWLLLRRRDPPNAITGSQVGGFLLGLVLIWIASASPVASCHEASLTRHMLQHLLLQTLAPPLILLGAPVMAVWRGTPRHVAHAIIDPLSRWPPARRLEKTLARPAFCWIAATATLVGWHIPALHTLALQSPAWHELQHATFLVTGVLFWWPVIRPWPSAPTGPQWSTVLYLFLATLPCDILSGFLVFSERIAYPVYLSSSRSPVSVMEDQMSAGALMWTVVTIVYLVAGTILSARLLEPHSSKGEPQVLEVA